MSVEIKYEGGYYIAILGIWAAQGKELWTALSRLAKVIQESKILGELP